MISTQSLYCQEFEHLYFVLNTFCVHLLFLHMVYVDNICDNIIWAAVQIPEDQFSREGVKMDLYMPETL